MTAAIMAAQKIGSVLIAESRSLPDVFKLKYLNGVNFKIISKQTNVVNQQAMLFGSAGFMGYA